MKKGLLVLFSLFLACSATFAEELKVCTMEYNPQCGVDGKTYSNPCMAGDIEIAYAGQCQTNDEIKVCTADYTPVCGVDGMTYSNECMAGDTEIAHTGECETEHVANICTREYNPVCGVNGITYSNPCMAGINEIAHTGECEVVSKLSTEDRALLENIKATLDVTYKNVVTKTLINYKLKVRGFDSTKQELITVMLIDELERRANTIIIQYGTNTALPTNANNLYSTYKYLSLELQQLDFE